MDVFNGFANHCATLLFLLNLVSSVLDFIKYRANLHNWKKIRLSDTVIFTKTKQGLSTNSSVTR